MLFYYIQCGNVSCADPGSIAPLCSVVHTFFLQNPQGSQGIVHAGYLREDSITNSGSLSSKPKGIFLLGKHQVYMSQKEVTLTPHPGFIVTPRITLFHLSSKSPLKGVTGFNRQSLKPIDTLITRASALFGSLHETC